MTHRHHVPALQSPAAGQRAPCAFASAYLANFNPLRAATCPIEEEGGRVTIVIEDFAP
ncbi:hypothetical protein IB232_11150 [Pseudomonas sp. PDM15]|uniref:hypothetical protein n=1 Tax=Pseudomonas sp. PDM15 TaxID=2769303 RepID=UPI001784FB1E|nr:hypothetical protein [Pseudomonas sp. PDM15]MBD9425878.1 hypothetical protein [Pseudomonas sp. PDM15]